jgi:hypothetical protein
MRAQADPFRPNSPLRTVSPRRAVFKDPFQPSTPVRQSSPERISGVYVPPARRASPERGAIRPRERKVEGSPVRGSVSPVRSQVSPLRGRSLSPNKRAGAIAQDFGPIGTPTRRNTINRASTIPEEAEGEAQSPTRGRGRGRF